MSSLFVLLVAFALIIVGICIVGICKPNFVITRKNAFNAFMIFLVLVFLFFKLSSITAPPRTSEQIATKEEKSKIEQKQQSEKKEQEVKKTANNNEKSLSLGLTLNEFQDKYNTLVKTTASENAKRMYTIQTMESQQNDDGSQVAIAHTNVDNSCLIVLFSASNSASKDYYIDNVAIVPIDNTDYSNIAKLGLAGYAFSVLTNEPPENFGTNAVKTMKVNGKIDKHMFYEAQNNVIIKSFDRARSKAIGFLFYNAESAVGILLAEHLIKAYANDNL